MSWTFGKWQDFLKKKACRYILQHYLGQFLKQKLSLDQLSLDLYNGTGKITDLNLDVQAINEDLASLSVPVELVDGFVECIVVSIPWSALIQSSTTLEVTGLELTLQPKQREDSGMMPGEMFSSMQASMTNSLQLAKDCLQSDADTGQKAEPIEGVQTFANMIDSVLSKIRVSLNNTVIRLEHSPDSSPKGVAMEIRIKRIEYFDDMATTSEGTSVDGNVTFEPAAFSQKNFHIDGVQLYLDEISCQKSTVRSCSSSEGSPPGMYISAQQSMVGGVYESLPKEAFPPHLSSMESNPIQVAVLTGHQEIKLKTKQTDTLHGPKLEIRCQFGGLHILMSPRQLHGALELLNSLSSPSLEGSSSKRPGVKNKPMDAGDFQKVEVDLQHQLQSGRIHSNNLAQLQDYSLGDEDDQFYSLMSGKAGTGSDMESSFSSNYSASTNRTSSSTPTGSQQNKGKSQKDAGFTPKFHEDPSAELSHYYVRVAFFSISLLHHNLSGNGNKSSEEMMKEAASQYFQSVGGVAAAGVTDLKDIRKKLSALLKHDHLRLLGKPLTMECNEKSAVKQNCTTLSVTVGIMELVEALYSKNVTEYSELLMFSRDGSEAKKTTAMYSSMQGGQPCFNMQLQTVAHNKRSSRPGSMPATDIKISMGELQMELDVTLIDRISTLITPEKIVSVSPLSGASMYHTMGQPDSLLQTIEEGATSHEQKISVEVMCPLARINIRFPIPDLRKESHVDKSWYQRNLREDVLIVDMERATVRLSLITGQPLEQVQISASDLHGYYKFGSGEEAQHFAHVSGEGGEDGFNNPMITVRFCKNTSSELEEDVYMDDLPPLDSLNGACQFAKSEPSAFSSRRHMHSTDTESQQAEEKTEQMVLPADREELTEFMQKSTNNTKMTVDIVLPRVCAILQNKHFFEVLYNRLNNDMLLWEPSAPSPVAVSHDHGAIYPPDLNVCQLLQYGQEHFEMVKSAIQPDSDSEDDLDNINHYSIHDSRYPRRKRPPKQQQSNLCLHLSIGQGRLTAFTDYKDFNGTVLGDKHGEVLMQISDFLLFTVSAHNGDPNIQFVNVLVNRADLYHTACVENTEVHPLIDCDELSAPVPPHLQPNHLIYRSEPGLLVNTKEDIGTGADSQNMVSVALRIKVDTLTSRSDLTLDEVVKEFRVAVGVRGATMRHRVVPPYESIFIQMMEFLDVKDYPILGYVDPKVLTELHVHIWTCAIDYRPIYLPLRSVILADSFTISSNIVTEASISLLRFVLEDGALFLSKKLRQQSTDLRKDYVCVADISRLELQLRSNTGNNPNFPKTELRVLSNLVNIRSCADSCLALIDLLKYVAGDGDLCPPEDSGPVSEAETNISTDGEENEVEEKGEDYPALTASSMAHVHNLMSEAMQESSNNSETSSKESSPEKSDPGKRQTEVFFVAGSEPDLSGSPSLSREPIVITQNVDSVTSSMMSGGLGGCSSDDDVGTEDSDDFCMIDDAAWGQSPKDGEPAIRVFSKTPVQIKENYFPKPDTRTDVLKAPDHFPLAESRYMLKELTVVWHIYGGKDFTESDADNTTENTSLRDGVSFHRGSPGEKWSGSGVTFHRGSPGDRWSGQAGGREMPLIPRETLLTKGGQGRDQNKCMEIQLTKVRFQHEQYPGGREQAARQVLLISDIEIRDKIKSSRMNKFLYQYSADGMPRQTYANMVVIKALHRRTSCTTADEECALKVSLQPIRFNIDQDTLFFLKDYFTDLSGQEEPSLTDSPRAKPCLSSASTPPPPVMTVNKQEQREATADPQDLLLQFDEFTQDLQASLRGSLRSSCHSDRGRAGSRKGSVSSQGTITSDIGRASQPVFIKSFVFSREVPIRIDYHGKFDREHGALAGLGGLVSLNRSELKLKPLTYKQGLLGGNRVLEYCVKEWLTDIKVNQLPAILGGFGPMHAIMQLAYGVKDLFWLPVEQYRKDGRIIRGLQRGATSFSMSTAMSVLELTNRVVLGVQWCAERTFDIVSPGPRRRGFYPRQPADIREGVTNAYIVLREGFSDTACTMVEVATKEHETKGMMGAVGGVIRQIPPTLVQPLIIVPEAASNVIGGLTSHLRPDVKKENEDKWKEEVID